MINILLSGCNGKMGNVISLLAENDDKLAVVAGFDINTITKFDYAVYNDLSLCKEKIDVIIDFSNPAAFDDITGFAKENNLPIVLATTGLDKAQIETVHKLSKEIPVFYSANMSIGINLLIDLAKKASKLLNDKFDIEIIEKHHNQKLDAPSGTALAIANAINEEFDNSYEYVYDRHSVRKKRGKKEIGIHAVRGGTIVGEHDILFAGNDEVITLSHSAMSKEIFAEGALKAAKYLYGKMSGFYNMNSMIDELA